jgi:cullin 3
MRFSFLHDVCRNAYNMVINKFGDRLYKGLVDTISRHLRVRIYSIGMANGC